MVQTDVTVDNIIGANITEETDGRDGGKKHSMG